MVNVYIQAILWALFVHRLSFVVTLANGSRKMNEIAGKIIISSILFFLLFLFLLSLSLLLFRQNYFCHRIVAAATAVD